MINIEEVEMLVRWYADEATKLVIMKNMVIVVIYQIFKQHSTYAKYTNDQDDDTSEYVFTTLQNQQL